jgi:hypothetical protein
MAYSEKVIDHYQNPKYDVIKALDKLKMGYHQPFTWNKLGIRTWQIG